ncbi:hypothetical protein AB0G60_02825 [Streptomyces angustmyceticus]|uniref:hypothetical protein n=1 Tax=Streptomyces angustmyceticus TaxID=285578 RepID=UPI00126063A4|nr:hypothetical protein [Streptomyces angustmyceticus]UAL65596.1 hypothetical protein K7396_02795 [Streptomyces angustmyceticus]
MPEFVASLPAESPLRGKYGQPPEYVMQWLLPVGAVVAGVLLLLSGAPAAGVLLLTVGAGLGFLFSRLAAAAEEARERWARSLYCRQCPATFPREDAVTV